MIIFIDENIISNEKNWLEMKFSGLQKVIGGFFLVRKAIAGFFSL